VLTGEQVDILVLTAVKDERDIVLRLEADWVERRDASGFVIHTRRDPGGLRWALARAADMGARVRFEPGHAARPRAQAALPRDDRGLRRMARQGRAL